MNKKKLLRLARIAAAFAAAHAGPALALTSAHMATATGASQGDCSICHVAHKATGIQRLFPNNPTAGSVTTYGYMGAMCAEYCHNIANTRQYAGNTALLNVGSSTISQAAHGLNLSGATMPPNTAVPTSLPYGDGNRGTNSQGVTGSFECTTCHDPHKNAAGDTSNALLRLDLDVLCGECHSNRGVGDGAWGANYGDANVLGSHPVGTDVLDDTEAPGAPDSNIFIGGVGAVGGNTAFDVAYGAASEHNLGGHLINGLAFDQGGAGITCASCHAVHGNQLDGGGTNVSPIPTGPFEDLLVIAQGVQGTTEPARSANGSGNPSNALCAGCHAYQGTDDWNPGGTAYTHPANSVTATSNMGTITDPSGGAWPYGNNAQPGLLDLGLICETCHKPHGAVSGSHILRMDEWTICGYCHTAAPTDHHPSGVAMGAMADPAIDGGNVGILECSDCHQGNGAHNWPAAGAVGLNPAWEPANNLRGAADAPGQFGVNMSKECIDCHTAGGTRNSPTLHNGNASTNGGTNTLQNRGDGSHFLGPTNNTGAGNLALGMISGSSFNPFTTAWPYNPAGSRGWSRFGGTGLSAYEIVCESCHELEFDKNVPGNALLLYNYHEREDQPMSRLCTGCHGEVPGGSSVHPLTGMQVSAAVDNPGRAVKTLITALTGYANQTAPGPAPNLAEYPATPDRMNCDSCHQPHDAPTESGSFILEYNDGVGTGLLPALVSGVNVLNHRASTGQAIPHTALCLQCHSY